jgi:Omp85 superfamily domain
VRTLKALKLFMMVAFALASATAASGQAPAAAPPEETNALATQAPPADSAQTSAPTSRQAAIEREQAAKAQVLHPYVPTRAEQILQRFDAVLQGARPRWHPFFESAYSGGGFTLGLGHANFVSASNYIDVRGSYSVEGYKRAEIEFVAPRLFNRRANLSVIGGWREATEVGFYGLGTNTSQDDRTSYLFQQPYGTALLTVFPTRRLLMLRGGAEFTQWSQEPGKGSFPSVETRYTPADLPGLGAEVTYLHTQGTLGIDWRTSAGYSRRGGFYGVTLHDYNDRDEEFGFQMLEYEAIQHIPILREAWVLSFRGRVQTAMEKDDQQTPFFMLPAIGGGHMLRGYSSWRFRDRNSLLLQAEWRIVVNRYLDMAFFYDTGKVAARRSDLDFDGLKDDFGFGLRFHGPSGTPLRVELANSQEGLKFVFASSAVF